MSCIIQRLTDGAFLTFLKIGEGCTTPHFSQNREAAVPLYPFEAEMYLTIFARNRPDLNFAILSTDE